MRPCRIRCHAGNRFSIDAEVLVEVFDVARFTEVGDAERRERLAVTTRRYSAGQESRPS
jgi:hypothetical protein